MSELPPILPLDESNRTLVENVHPTDWTNPEPSGRYDLVVVGAGSAGLITAAVAAGLGARTALIERHYLGGDCLNVGCVPSKGVIRGARMVAEARRAASELGLPLEKEAQPDFGAVMARMRGLRARISHEDAAARYRDELGVDVYLGDARFTGRDEVEVGGAALRFKRAAIATGARAGMPPIPGLDEAGALTNETVFNLTERPRRLGVIGGGPIGCELAQAFQRLGCQVVLLDVAPQVLPREDADAAALVQERLGAEGVRLILGVSIARVEKSGAEKIIRFSGADGRSEAVAVDELLVAAGRTANVEDMGLEAAGVKFDPSRGVQVDDHLCTSNPRIFAAGDVCMAWKFTHAADAAAKIVVQNALFALGPFGRKKLSDLVMPWCTYTDPEVAHVGRYEHEIQEGCDTYTVPLSDVNRAVLDGDDQGFVRVHVRRGKDEILGATLVAAHAGEMISEVTLAMVGGLGLGRFLDVIHPYPTQAEGIKRAAGLWVRTRLTPAAKIALKLLMSLKR
jgi:pyruvate/2-oxoglutarate dehydrogenase complex dihydrolipoamide dehydrogenase (E3) component